MGCGGSSDKGAQPRKGGAANKKKKKGRKKGKGSAMMIAQGENKQDKFWDKEDLLTATLGKGNAAAKGEGFLAMAYVDRPLEDKKGSRYNFLVAKSKDFDFKLGFAELVNEDADSDEEASDLEDAELAIHNSWTLDFKTQKCEVKKWDESEEELVESGSAKPYNLKNLIEEKSVITMAVVDGKVEFAIDDQDLDVAFDDKKIAGKNIYPVVIFNGEEKDSEASEEESDEDSDAEKKPKNDDKV